MTGPFVKYGRAADEEDSARQHENLLGAYQQLAYWWRTRHSCPCGAREEALDTHGHVPGCPTERAVRILEETT